MDRCTCTIVVGFLLTVMLTEDCLRRGPLKGVRRWHS